MQINGVVVVEEPKRSELKLLETSTGIVTVIQRSISWATVGKINVQLVYFMLLGIYIFPVVYWKMN